MYTEVQVMERFKKIKVSMPVDDAVQSWLDQYKQMEGL